MFAAQHEVVFHLPNLIVGLVAVLGGVVMAIANYFWLHADTEMTRKQMWEHIWGLLCFYIVGMLIFGLLAWLLCMALGVPL